MRAISSSPGCTTSRLWNSPRSGKLRTSVMISLKTPDSGLSNTSSHQRL